jgi:hypothetical protein
MNFDQRKVCLNDFMNVYIKLKNCNKRTPHQTLVDLLSRVQLRTIGNGGVGALEAIDHI